MIYAAILVKQFGEGRICISSDRISGYLSGHGEGHIPLWRKIIEWTSQKYTDEIPNVALVENASYSAYESVKDLKYISVYRKTVEDLARDPLSFYDLIYFSGLPDSVYPEVALSLRTFVENGGGIVVEDPNRGGENINVISAIDSIYCLSTQRPTYSFANWTVSGLAHYIYDQDAKVSFMTTLDTTYIPSDWSVLMSNIPTKTSVSTSATASVYETIAKTGSEFGLSFVSSMQNGVVILEEVAESSSSSMDSSSSSSFEDPDYWNFCDNIVAYWKMDENLNSPVVWDSTGDMKHVGLLKNNISSINTSTRHVPGVVNGALSFDGIANYIETMSNYSLNFVESGVDVPFSVSMWIYPKSIAQNCFIRKVGVWSIYVNGGVVYGLMENGLNYRRWSSNISIIKENYWQNLTVTYDGTATGFKVYVDGRYISSSVMASGYTAMANVNSVAYMATDENDYFFNGYMDNVLIVKKTLSIIEVEALYNIGRGTDQCEGIYEYTSSSSSSSSQSSSSSSSSVDSSSSSSSSSVDSSSSSSSSSANISSSSSSSSSSP